MRAVKLAPTSPGVYRMLNAANDVLYVGKAKSVKKRLASYARPTGHGRAHRADDRGDRQCGNDLHGDRDRSPAA